LLPVAQRSASTRVPRRGWIHKKSTAILGYSILVIAVAAPVYTFYPALMNADSLTLYAGAVIPGPVLDWHSAFLTLLMRAIVRLGTGVALFTAIQSTLYVVALYRVLALAPLGIPARLGVLALVLLVPPTMPWLAAAEKTTFMAATLAACFACSLYLEAGARYRALLLAGVLATAVVGTWCRPNAIIIFLPVVLLTAWQAWRMRGSRLVPALLVAGFLLAGLGGPSAAVRTGLVVRTWPQQATMDLDLLSLSVRTGRLLIPPSILAAPYDSVKAALAIDPHVLWRLDTSLRRITTADDMQMLQSAWLSAIRQYPLVYLRERAGLYRQYLCFDLSIVCYDSWHWYTGGIDVNPFGLTSHKRELPFRFYKALAGSVVFHPFFHVLAVAAVLAAAMALRRRVVGVYAAVLLAYDFAGAFIIPSSPTRMVVPLGLMLPLLIAALYIPGSGGQARAVTRLASSADERDGGAWPPQASQAADRDRVPRQSNPRFRTGTPRAGFAAGHR
jgi:hypothetical protein